MKRPPLHIYVRKLYISESKVSVFALSLFSVFYRCYNAKSLAKLKKLSSTGERRKEFSDMHYGSKGWYVEELKKKELPTMKEESFKASKVLPCQSAGNKKQA